MCIDSRLVKILHTSFRVEFEVGDEKVTLPASVGVKQGDTLAPVLFLIFLQAALHAATDNWGTEISSFMSREDGTVAGRRFNAKGTPFEFFYSLFADDGAFLFNSRQDMQAGAEMLFQQLRKFGLTMHVGQGGRKSKTEAMLIAGNGSEDTSDFQAGGGCIHFVDEFRYLGSIIHKDLDDAHDVKARIAQAGAAFGSLRRCFFSAKHVPIAHKRTAFTGLILAILLYGCESWALTKAGEMRLERFFRQCCRAMCRVNRWHTREHHISQQALERRLGLLPLKVYLRRRQLGWAGHVARMSHERLPRKFLSAWVPKSRPRGRPRMTWGHNLQRALREINVPVKEWMKAAQDRKIWRELYVDVAV